MTSLSNSQIYVPVVFRLQLAKLSYENALQLIEHLLNMKVRNKSTAVVLRRMRYVHTFLFCDMHIEYIVILTTHWYIHTTDIYVRYKGDNFL